MRDSLSRYPFTFFFFLVLTSIILLASPHTIRSLEREEPSDSHRTRINKDILKGIHLLYDRRFNDAEVLFKRVIGQTPDRPIGYFYLAMVSWSRVVSGFWSPENVKEYLERVDRTISVARRRIENSDAESYDYFYLGGALGFKGRFELSRGNWLSSFFLATEAIEALKRCLNMDPNNKDVLLGIGIFDYYTTRLSGVLKFLSYLLIHKGDKEEGLRKLNIAASEATYSGTEAKSMLLHIYLFLEEDFPKSLIIAKALAERYDENPRFKVLEGVTYIRLGMDPQFWNRVHGLRQRSLSASSSKMASMWERSTPNWLRFSNKRVFSLFI